jgi:hypothetical protein
VRQFGYLQREYRDARLTEHKIHQLYFLLHFRYAAGKEIPLYHNMSVSFMPIQGIFEMTDLYPTNVENWASS